MRLAFFYEKGIGVKQDLHKSWAWYYRAAVKGNAKAQYKLGLSFANGHGVNIDMPQAVAWLEHAANNGSALGAIVKTTLATSVSAQALEQARVKVKNELQPHILLGVDTSPP